MTDYPEHEKLSAIAEESQTIGEFVDWLRSPVADGGKGFHFQVWKEWTEDDVCPRCGLLDPETNRGRRTRKTCRLCNGSGLVTRHKKGYMPAGISVVDLLAEFFEINQKTIEAEKRAMLAASRS